MKDLHEFSLNLKILQDENVVVFQLEFTRMGVGGASTGNWRQLIRKSMEDLNALKKNGFHFPVFVIQAKIGRKLPQLLKR